MTTNDYNLTGDSAIRKSLPLPPLFLMDSSVIYASGKTYYMGSVKGAQYVLGIWTYRVLCRADDSARMIPESQLTEVKIKV